MKNLRSFVTPLALSIALSAPSLLSSQQSPSVPSGQVHSHDHSHDSAHSGQEGEVLSFVEVIPETQEFKDATDNLRELLRKLVEYELRFHNSDTPEQEELFRQQWYDLREEAFELHRAMMHAGLAEYLTAPDSKQNLANFLFASLKRNVENDVYEGMLPIAQALYENNYPAPELPGFLVLSCLAECEYELVRQPLEQIVQQGQAPEELVTILGDLDELAAAWKQELDRRQSDESGPALPQARIKTTKGTVVIELFENDAPQAVANFIWLAEQGFYNYKPFFMVLKNFMAQTGCPTGDGTGGPGYYIPGEEDASAKRGIFRGSVALNLLPDLPDSGGSQFMIVYLPLPDLEKQSTVFGRVVSGMPNVARLNRIDPQAKKSEGEPPPEPDEIISIEITGKRDHAYEPTRLRQPFRSDAPPVRNDSSPKAE